MSKSKLSKYAPLIAAVGAAGFGGIAGYYVFNQFQEGEKDLQTESEAVGHKNSGEKTIQVPSSGSRHKDVDPGELTELTDENSVPSKLPKPKLPPSAGIGHKDAESGKVPTIPLPHLPPPTEEQREENSVPSMLPKLPLPQVPPPEGAPDKDQVYVMTPDGAIQPFLPFDGDRADDKVKR